MAAPKKPPKKPPAPAAEPSTKYTNTPTFLGILTELDVNKDQVQKRQALIRKIELQLTERYGAENRLISYVFRFGHSRATVNTADIPSIEALLNSVAGAQQINLLLHSPGGDGTIVEKVVEMCRAHLSGEKRKFRVIVPNVAKSAATVMALGADQIVMGYCSELGPIDPQIQIVVSGVVQWVSALSFSEARDRIMKEITNAEKKKLPTIGLLQQLAGLNMTFIQEAEHQTDFAKKAAARLLEKYMLKPRINGGPQRKRKALEIAKKLLSKQLFPVHGHFIDGTAAKKELELEVDVLDKELPLWKDIWDFYVRSEVGLNIGTQPPMVRIKLFESSSLSLVTQDTGH